MNTYQPYANLQDANLRDADLRSANLRHADLYGADLCGADLRGANLYGADLRHAAWVGLVVDGLPSGRLLLVPTPTGWSIAVGCWSGDIDSLETMVAGEDWVTSDADERVERRPALTAAIALCRAHIAAHPGVVPALAAKWGGEQA